MIIFPNKNYKDIPHARHVGGKGHNLIKLANLLGNSVPPGAIITTQTCNNYIESVTLSAKLSIINDLRSQIYRVSSKIMQVFSMAICV